MVRRKGVSIKVDLKFFNNVFEPARKELQKQTGTRVSQIDLTAFLEKQKIKFKLKQPKNVSIPKTKKPLKRGFNLL